MSREELAAFQRALQEAGDVARERAAPGAAGEFLRGVAHGYYKAAEEVVRWVYQGRLSVDDE
jgi:hypothetical protein